uniref:Peptidoglycan recognition receptor protein n=1 Tax=Mimachlamys nobilis TaxID=106276 RepID=A0A3S9K250_MIMNO|nr:peptidoglycan recognition receptor protein [Mimachlamys nobilis]
MDQVTRTTCLLVLLIPACLSIPNGLVDGCTASGGVCQDDSNKCAGSYITGKCAGPVTTRCCTKNISIRDTKECKNVMIISRDSWGARRPKESQHLKTPVGDFFIHHTATQNCTSTKDCVGLMKIIQNFHMDTRQWFDIAYSFLVGEDGHVYEGRGWDTVGSHTLGCNSISLAASMMGNFDKVLPNEAALTAVKRLITCGVEIGRLSKDYSLFGHRDVRPTDCPGNALYKQISSWAHFHSHKPGCNSIQI